VAIKDAKTITEEQPGCSGQKWALPQQGSDENGYPGMELDGMMEYPVAARQRTCGASSFGADEWMECGPPCDGPEQWPEWKIEDDLAYQQYLNVFFKGDVDRPVKRSG
jgi:hypothetical protein